MCINRRMFTRKNLTYYITRSFVSILLFIIYVWLKIYVPYSCIIYVQKYTFRILKLYNINQLRNFYLRQVINKYNFNSIAFGLSLFTCLSRYIVYTSLSKRRVCNTWRRTGSSSLSFPRCSQAIREIGTKDRAEKAAERPRRHRFAPYTSDTEERASRARLGHYYADDYRASRLGENRFALSRDLFPRVKRKAT